MQLPLYGALQTVRAALRVDHSTIQGETKDDVPVPRALWTHAVALGKHRLWWSGFGGLYTARDSRRH